MTTTTSEMANKAKYDSSLLQFVPKGGYYNTEEEQQKQIIETWNSFLKEDRLVFALSMLLPGTAYSKGRMSHLLLSNPVLKKFNNELKLYGLDYEFEEKIIDWNLKHESIPRSLKNLMMLTGIKDKLNKFIVERVNNSRARKVVLSYIFNRDIDSLESLSIKYKPKISQLVRHALGKYNLYHVLTGDAHSHIFHKMIGVYFKDERGSEKAFAILLHLFNKEQKMDLAKLGLNKIKLYYDLKQACEEQNVNKFKEAMESKIFAPEVLIGFRNKYKVPIELKDLIEKSKMSEKQKLQMETSAKKQGVEIEVDYNKQDIYDLYKVFYHKIFNKDTGNLLKVAEAINKKSEDKVEIDLGKIVVIFDASVSMSGSKERPLHPFLTGLSLVSVLDKIEDVIYVGGSKIETGIESVPTAVIPAGSTELWRALIQAIDKKPDTILIVSDGYENVVKGTFEVVYNALKNKLGKTNIIHVNPVYSAEAKGMKKLAKDINPMALDNYKFLKTNLLFELMQFNKKQVKEILSKEYKKRLLKQ